MCLIEHSVQLLAATMHEQDLLHQASFTVKPKDVYLTQKFV